MMSPYLVIGTLWYGAVVRSHLTTIARHLSTVRRDVM